MMQSSVKHISFRCNDQQRTGNAWKMIHAGATQDACHHDCMQRYLHIAVTDLTTTAPPMRFHLADYEEGTAVCSLPAQAHGRSYLNLRLSIAMAGLMWSYGRCMSIDHRPHTDDACPQAWLHTDTDHDRTCRRQASPRRRLACTNRLILALET